MLKDSGFDAMKQFYHGQGSECVIDLYQDIIIECITSNQIDGDRINNMNNQEFVNILHEFIMKYKNDEAKKVDSAALKSALSKLFTIIKTMVDKDLCQIMDISTSMQ